MQKVGCVIQIIAWINKGLADRIFVGPGRDGGHLGNQTVRGNLALLLVRDVCAVVIESRHRAHNADHDRHGVRIASEAAEEESENFTRHQKQSHLRVWPRRRREILNH